MISLDQTRSPEPEKLPLHAQLRRIAVADIIKCGTTGWSMKLDGVCDQSLKTLKESVEKEGYLSFDSAGIDKDTGEIVVNFQATTQFFEKFKEQIVDAWIAWCDSKSRSWSPTHSKLHLPLRPEVSTAENPAIKAFMRNSDRLRNIKYPLFEIGREGLIIKSDRDFIHTSPRNMIIS